MPNGTNIKMKDTVLVFKELTGHWKKADIYRFLFYFFKEKEREREGEGTGKGQQGNRSNG